ncbi:unnamed protein product [Closterium sp. NIES-65]|nr:unnamed protein product [Closterium sp. NIES-65]
MDPLSVLREYTMRNELDRVTIVGDDCCFGNEYRFPRAVETAYRRRGGDRYNLESLLLFVQCKAVKHTEYMQRARAQTLQIVTFTDRKPLLVCLPRPSLLSLAEYLEGHLQTTDAIDLIAPIGLPPSAPPSAAPPASIPSSGAATSAAPGGLGQGAHGSTSAAVDGATGPGGLGAAEAGDQARKRSRWDTDKRASGAGGDAGAAGADGGGAGGYDVYGKRQRGEGSQAGLGTGRGIAYHSEAVPGMAAAGLTVGGLGLGGGGMSEEEEREAIRELIKRERPVRDRETVLLCPRKKDAFASVLAMLNRREHERKKLDVAHREASKRGHPPAPSSARPSRDARGGGAGAGAAGGGGGGGGGGRQDERQVWRDYMGTDALEELGINPTQSSYVQPGRGGSGGAAGSGAAGGGGSGSGALVVASQGKPEGQHSRSQPSNPPPSSRHARPHGNPAHQSQHKQHGSSGGGSGSGSAAAAAAGSLVPIILVPSAAQTLINIFNVKDFLEDGAYVPAEEKAKAAGGKRPEMVAVQRRMGRDKAVVYHVRDRPEGLSKRDWDRVAAVFVLGKEWQFKGWPFKESMLKAPQTHAWLDLPPCPPCMACPHVPHAWLAPMSPMHGLPPCPPCMACPHVPHAWLAPMSPMHGLPPCPPCMACLHDWDRVAAVFVLGKEWQFKGWPFKDHVDILSKVMGVFVRFEDDSVESAATVKNWNCSILAHTSLSLHILCSLPSSFPPTPPHPNLPSLLHSSPPLHTSQISKYKRHQDRTAALTFWDRLDKFLAARKSVLAY